MEGWVNRLGPHRVLRLGACWSSTFRARPIKIVALFAVAAAQMHAHTPATAAQFTATCSRSRAAEKYSVRHGGGLWPAPRPTGTRKLRTRARGCIRRAAMASAPLSPRLAGVACPERNWGGHRCNAKRRPGGRFRSAQPHECTAARPSQAAWPGRAARTAPLRRGVIASLTKITRRSVHSRRRASALYRTGTGIELAWLPRLVQLARKGDSTFSNR
jgi:hypothetical protein